MKYTTLVGLWAGLLMSGASMAQTTFTPEERAQGYALRDDFKKAYFLFDESLYGKKPEQVVVTGSFRGWSHDMSDWQLKSMGDGLWVLETENPDLSKVAPSAEFKFRIDKGQWLDAAAKAPNKKSGNLIFMQGVTPPTLRAEIRRNGTIWAKVEGMDRPLDTKSYRLTDGKGREIAIAQVLPNTATETLVKAAEPLDPRRVYYLEIPSKKLRSVASFDGWFRDLYSAKELGANIAPDGTKTDFRVFAPRATAMKLYLYKGKDDKQAYATYDMVQDADGVWEMAVPGNLKGVYYDFTVHGADDPGNSFYETTPIHISDPYARVNDDAWGKSRVWTKTKPATPLKNGIPAMQDVIAYEVHVQDFTDNLPVADNLKGTMKAMTMPGLKNKKGEKIGFDFLVDLGVNVVHLQPMQEFMHYPDSAWRRSFENDPYMIAQGINKENYQWGYRTSHAFAVENRFRTKGSELGAERDQFRDLVQAFHDKGIAVIIDIVPNHTHEDMEGHGNITHLNALDRQYYYRTNNDLKHIGEYGNEVKTENRPMAQRWLIEQVKQFVDEFGIDGVRIDLAGQMDEQTLKAFKEGIGQDKIVYGEPWIASNDPNYENNPDWDWYKADSPITFFQDDTRNALKGPTSNPENKATDRGFAGGNLAERANAMKALENSFAEDKTPLSGINYLDIHDNWALADQFATKDWDGRYGVDENRMKIAAVLLYTSMGPIVNHGGTEIMRSKGSAPLEESVKVLKWGEKEIKLYYHGKRDTYNTRVANQYVWDNVGKTSKEAPADYKNMYAFWKGLNTFRKSSFGSVFRKAEAQPKGYYQFVAPASQPGVLGYVVDGKVFVLLNAGDKAEQVSGIQLPAGNWKRVANNQQVNIKGVKGANAKLKGGAQTLQIPAEGLGIWVKE